MHSAVDKYLSQIKYICQFSSLPHLPFKEIRPGGVVKVKGVLSRELFRPRRFGGVLDFFKFSQ